MTTLLLCWHHETAARVLTFPSAVCNGELVHTEKQALQWVCFLAQFLEGCEKALGACGPNVAALEANLPCGETESKGEVWWLGRSMVSVSVSELKGSFSYPWLRKEHGNSVVTKQGQKLL